MKQSAETRTIVCTRTYPGGWARDVDEKTALRALRHEWPHQLSDYGYAVYDVEPETYINDFGSFVHPVGMPPKLVREVEGKKKIKKVTA